VLCAAVVNGNAYPRKILIPLRHHERIELFRPYLEELAWPGSTIVFLAPISHNRFNTVTDQLLTMNTGFSFIPAEATPPTQSSGKFVNNKFTLRVTAENFDTFEQTIECKDEGKMVLNIGLRPTGP